MVQRRLGGLRRKTRSLFKKSIKQRGKISLSRFLQSFKIGEPVHISIEPSYPKGQAFRRFIGKTGIVQAKRGNCYEVKINDKGVHKTLIIHPIHLRGTKK